MHRFAYQTAAVLALGVCLACGDGGRELPELADARPMDDADTTMVDAAPPDDDDAGDTTPDAAPVPDAEMDPLGPQVVVVFPDEPAAGDFDSDAIVATRVLTARCSVGPNATTSTPVDASSITLSVSGGGQEATGPARPSAIPGQFEANLDLSAFPNGPITVTCTASDTSTPALTSSDQVETFLDLGPRITMLSPPADGVFFAGSVPVQFQVTPDPVAAGDTDGSAVDEDGVVLEILGTEIALTRSGDIYSASVPFDAFSPPLDDEVTLVIRAPNERAPAAVTRERFVLVNADNDGPAIDIIDPAEGELVGGLLLVEVAVTDPAGVGSVVATMAHDLEFELTPVGGDRFRGVFDTRLLDRKFVFPLLEVRAIDAVGNEATAGQVLGLDTTPPLIALDSPPVREAVLNKVGEIIACSELFDPLGGDTLKDGMTAAQLSEIRVRVEDMPNGPKVTTPLAVPIALVNEASVELYVLDDSETIEPLVDTDGDGVCDEINPLIVPTTVPVASNEAALISMVPLEPAGDSIFVFPPTVPYGDTPEVLDDDCMAPTPVLPPPALCFETSPATRVTFSDFHRQAPVIFTIPPAADLACMGNAFDSFASNISDGWACVIARAEDNIGNVAVSAPMRICFDADLDGTDDIDGEGGTGTSLASIGCATDPFDVGDPSGQCPVTTCALPESFADRPDKNLVLLEEREPECADGFDNDGDGLADGIDTDGDGFVDDGDPECLTADHDDEGEPPPGVGLP